MSITVNVALAVNSNNYFSVTNIVNQDGDPPAAVTLAEARVYEDDGETQVGLTLTLALVPASSPEIYAGTGPDDQIVDQETKIVEFRVTADGTTRNIRQTVVPTTGPVN